VMQLEEGQVQEQFFF